MPYFCLCSSKLRKEILFLLVVMLQACSSSHPEATQLNRQAKLQPDYSDITIPPNIAPLNFSIQEKAESYSVNICEANGESIRINSKDGVIRIPRAKWKSLLEQCKGKELFIKVFAKQHGKWIQFSTITNYVALEPIDSHLVYRLIEPGYEIWNKMGIDQIRLNFFNDFFELR